MTLCPPSQSIQAPPSQGVAWQLLSQLQTLSATHPRHTSRPLRAEQERGATQKNQSTPRLTRRVEVDVRPEDEEEDRLFCWVGNVLWKQE